VDSLKERAYEIIRDKILNCELKPGAVVDQNALMEEIGVSKTPIREAINMLENEGLLTVMPRRAVAVSHVSLSDIHQMYFVRELVEPVVARLACHAPNLEELKEYYRVFSTEKIDSDSVIKTDFRLHSHLVRLTENKYLIRLMDNVLCHNMRFVVLGAGTVERLKTGNREHMKVIEAIVNRDEREAEATMRAHIEYARTVAFAVNNILL
jgi:DNA-binding GntR family transcriptional regulator